MPGSDDILGSYNRMIDLLIEMCQLYKRSGSEHHLSQINEAYEYQVTKRL